MYPPTNAFNKIKFIRIIRTPTHMALEYLTQEVTEQGNVSPAHQSRYYTAHPEEA